METRTLWAVDSRKVEDVARDIVEVLAVQRAVYLKSRKPFFTAAEARRCGYRVTIIVEPAE